MNGTLGNLLPGNEWVGGGTQQIVGARRRDEGKDWLFTNSFSSSQALSSTFPSLSSLSQKNPFHDPILFSVCQ